MHNYALRTPRSRPSHANRAKIIVVPDKNAMTNAALAKLLPLLKDKSISSWILAAGNTQAGLYKRISELCQEGVFSFGNRQILGLDEYRGLPLWDERSLRSFMNRNLFNGIDIDRRNIHWPQSEPVGDPRFAVSKYRNEIFTYGPADVAVLGIGANGHIGFNEPGQEAHSGRASRARMVKLSPETRERNGVPFGEAITMGIADILESKRIILMASGTAKADAIARALDPKYPQGLDCPASFLRGHPDLTVIMDEGAASNLPQHMLSEGRARLSELLRST